MLELDTRKEVTNSPRKAEGKAEGGGRARKGVDGRPSGWFLGIMASMGFVAVVYTALQASQTGRDLAHAYYRIEALEADRQRITALEDFVGDYQDAPRYPWEVVKINGADRQ